uniref:CSON001666 protein n=1 Tax=Culicoides sonorensis TaxID=179676 RepID=A0A336MHP3_CULSO
MAEADAFHLLKLALSLDENGHKREAVKAYADVVESILSLPPNLKEKHKHFAVDALERAEKLKQELKANSRKSSLNDVNLPSRESEIPGNSGTTSDSSPVHQRPRLEVSGSKEVYTDHEKKVLEFTSHINNKIYVPFMDIDLHEKFTFPMPFTDKDGKLLLSDKQKRDFTGWARISELSEDPKMIAGPYPDFYSIKQTVVSDCSFVASLAVSSLYEKKFNKQILTSIIFPRNSKGQPVYNSSGKYSVKLHVNGIPRKVVIDDYLPVGRYNQLLCSYSNNKHEFWVSLLEKAYMKVMGGYDFPGSNSNIDLHALTGWIPERISIRQNDAEFNKDAVYDRLKLGLEKGRCLITVATGELSDAESDRTGLVSTHAYAVLDMKEVDDVQLILLKNPWSHLRWKGNYSELDIVHWTPEMQRALNYDPKLASNYDNGIFWMDYASLLKFFDVFYINWNPELFQYTYCIHQAWSAGVGPTRDAYNIGENPQFSLTVPAGMGSVWILLTRHITMIEDFRENKEYITVLVYKTNGNRVYYPYDPEPYIDGIRTNSPHYLCKIKLDPNSSRKYTLVVSQYEKTSTIYYTLRAFSRTKFDLRRLNDVYASKKELTGEWKGATAGGCPNHPSTYKNNPLYKLTIGPKFESDLVVELRGPKVYQVGLEVTVHSLENSEVTAPFVTKSTGNYRSGFCVLDLHDIPAGIYHIRPSTFLPNQEGPFFITFKSTTTLTVERVH